MRKVLENYILTMAGLIITFILFIGANSGLLGLHLSLNDQYIVFAIGVMTTLVIATLEHEIPKLFASQIDKKIELYKLFSEIEDEEFRGWAKDILSDSEYKLRKLAQGEFRSRMGALYEAGRLHQAQKKISAVYLGTVYQLLGFHSWTRTPEAGRFYRENLDAIKRGVEVIRVFILLRNKTVDEALGSILDKAIVTEMKKQQKDGIQVRVAWENEVVSLAGGEVLKDFVILDTFEIDEREITPDGNYEVVIWKNPTKIQHFLYIYSILHLNSLPLDNFLDQVKEES